MVLNKLQVLQQSYGLPRAISIMAAFESLRSVFADLVLPANCAGARQRESLALLEEHGLVELREEYDDDRDLTRGWYQFTDEGREVLKAVLRS